MTKNTLIATLLNNIIVKFEVVFIDWGIASLNNYEGAHFFTDLINRQRKFVYIRVFLVNIFKKRIFYPSQNRLNCIVIVCLCVCLGSEDLQACL